MKYKLLFTEEAENTLNDLKNSKNLAKQHKGVCKALGYMTQNLRHKGLNTHKLKGIKGINGEEILEAYTQNNTPGAYRIFWHYGPEKNCLTIISIIPHP